eukprot:1159237-Pelagomonas_calceolata.AAC.5
MDCIHRLFVPCSASALIRFCAVQSSTASTSIQAFVQCDPCLQAHQFEPSCSAILDCRHFNPCLCAVQSFLLEALQSKLSAMGCKRWDDGCFWCTWHSMQRTGSTMQPCSSQIILGSVQVLYAGEALASLLVGNSCPSCTKPGLACLALRSRLLSFKFKSGDAAAEDAGGEGKPLHDDSVSNKEEDAMLDGGASAGAPDTLPMKLF